MKKTKALFPASFNPIHNGHAEIIKFAAEEYDELIIFVANNEIKKYPIIIAERFELVKDFVDSLGLDNVKVLKQDNKSILTPDVAKWNEVEFIIRGIKETEKGILEEKLNEYEGNLADRYLAENPDLKFHYVRMEGVTVSSTEVRELAKLREEIKHLVPEVVYRKIRTLYE